MGFRFWCVNPYAPYTDRTTAYKKASVGTTVEVADGTILPVDRFGTDEVDLDQSDTTIKASGDGFRRVCAKTFA